MPQQNIASARLTIAKLSFNYRIKWLWLQLLQPASKEVADIEPAGCLRDAATLVFISDAFIKFL